VAARAAARVLAHVVDQAHVGAELVAQPVAPGDRVRWNGTYEGRVEAVNGETAVVTEQNNKLFGRTIKWRLRLDSLVRC